MIKDMELNALLERMIDCRAALRFLEDAAVKLLEEPVQQSNAITDGLRACFDDLWSRLQGLVGWRNSPPVTSRVSHRWEISRPVGRAHSGRTTTPDC